MRISLLFLALSAAVAADVEPLLKQPILAPKQPQVEVQVYTASKVPAVPSFATAAEWQTYADRLRKRVLDEVIFRGEARSWRDARTRVEWTDVIEGPGYRVRKFRYEAIPGLWLPALLYEPANLTGKVPAVLNVNGHEGTGIATPYIQQRCINLAKKGLLAMNPEWIGRGQLSWDNFNHYRMPQIDLTGTSGLAVFYLAMTRALDVLTALPNTDASRIGVTGLSGGGWQTIILSALDTRVALASPLAGYSSYVTRAQWPELDLGDSEQTPSDLASVADYAHLTAMMAPRPFQVANNANDNCCFRADYVTGALVHAATPAYSLFNALDRLRYHVNYGNGHNYDQDNREAFYRLLRDFFDTRLDAREIPSESEVRTADQLRVEVPQDNLDFQTLARNLSRDLPRASALPAGNTERRFKLAQVAHVRVLPVEATAAATQVVDGTTVTHWKLKMDRAWTVPAVELAPADPKSTVILIADAGRSSAAAEIHRLLSEGRRVVAVDPFYFGESHIATRDFLFALLLAGVGERPLGLQAGQVAAAARWLKTERNAGASSLHAIGPRTSLAAMIAAALEPDAIAGAELTGSMRSLKEVIENNMVADKTPELFCFGLLESFDIPQIAALVAPRPLKF